MTASAKTLFVGTIGLLFAVFAGSLVGESEWILPLVLTAVVLLAGVYIAFFRRFSIEALILGGLLIGYIVGNRGFAQISPVKGAPVFLGEIGLAICVSFMATRYAVTRQALIPRTALAYTVTAFVILGSIRLYLDAVARLSNASLINVLRDGATIYYALFFFIAYRVGSMPRDRSMIQQCLLFAFLALLPIAIVETVTPTNLYRLTLRGNPLILHRSDILVSCLQAGSIFFFLRPASQIRNVLWKLLAGLSSIAIFAFPSRAVFIGLLFVIPFLLAARQRRYLLFQVTMGAAALMMMMLLQAAGFKGHGETVNAFADKLTSITDLSGTRSYRGSSGDISSDNNQFRLVWWRTIIRETTQKAPVFGLGFGYDLAAGFLQEYYATRAGEFDTRSPHSVWLTMYGRMGLVGVLCFAAISAMIIRGAWRDAHAVARREQTWDVLFYWCTAIIFLAAASFGVVLEGPMGAIPFWSCLGLAASAPRRITPRRPFEHPPVERQTIAERFRLSTVEA